jgi:septum formation protein
MTFVLASASPRRAELLASAGFSFLVDPVDIDESAWPGEDPTAHVRRLAREKAAAGSRRHGGRLTVGADTVVVLDDVILGKPRDDDDARRMLESLSGRVHHVFTGVCVARNGQVLDAVDVSAVTMSAWTEAEIEQYVASGEPRDKAGAYAIQGWASRRIDRIEGSWSGVVGLPIAVVHRLLISL